MATEFDPRRTRDDIREVTYTEAVTGKQRTLRAKDGLFRPQNDADVRVLEGFGFTVARAETASAKPASASRKAAKRKAAPKPAADRPVPAETTDTAATPTDEGGDR